MIKIVKYANGQTRISGGIASITPSGIKPTAEVDVTDKTKEEIDKIVKSKKLFDKLSIKV
jgi:hypothetical protein